MTIYERNAIKCPEKIKCFEEKLAKLNNDVDLEKVDLEKVDSKKAALQQQLKNCKIEIKKGPLIPLTKKDREKSSELKTQKSNLEKDIEKLSQTQKLKTIYDIKSGINDLNGIYKKIYTDQSDSLRNTSSNVLASVFNEFSLLNNFVIGVFNPFYDKQKLLIDDSYSKASKQAEETISDLLSKTKASTIDETITKIKNGIDILKKDTSIQGKCTSTIEQTITSFFKNISAAYQNKCESKCTELMAEIKNWKATIEAKKPASKVDELNTAFNHIATIAKNCNGEIPEEVIKTLDKCFRENRVYYIHKETPEKVPEEYNYFKNPKTTIIMVALMCLLIDINANPEEKILNYLAKK